MSLFGLMVVGAESHAPALGQMAPATSALSIAFLYDVTISATNFDLLQPVPATETKSQYVKAMTALAAAIRPEDTVRLGIVTSRLRLGAPLSERDRRRLLDLVPDVPASERYGPSPLWDAIYDATTALAGEPGAVVLLVTDCRSTANRHGLAELVAHATATKTPVSTIVEDAFLRRPGTPPPVAPVQTCANLASATGGLSEFDDGRNPRGDIGQIVRAIIADVRVRHGATETSIAKPGDWR
jgi:hypothetical protein